MMLGDTKVSFRLMAYYMSLDRVLSFVDLDKLGESARMALSGQRFPMSSYILSNEVGKHLIDAITTGNVKTLQQLAFEGALVPGQTFIYDGRFYGNGFSARNKTPLLSLSEKLSEPLEGKKLHFEFGKDGLINDTAYGRLQGSTRLFAFGYINDIRGETICATPYVIGDLVQSDLYLPIPFHQQLQMAPREIAQFSGIQHKWRPSKKDFERMREIPERAVKELLCELLGEPCVPLDWGGEECDLYTANLMVKGSPMTGAFLLKGPAKFHPMTPKDLGKNADQLYRLFNTPADVYIIQHCHTIGPAVRKTAEAFALTRGLTAPCRLVFMDGYATAELLRFHGRWTKKTMMTSSASS